MHELLLLRRVATRPHRVENRCQVPPQHRRCVKVQAGEDAALVYAVRVGVHLYISLAIEGEPVEAVLKYPQDQVLLDAVEAVDLELVVQVVALQRGGHLPAKFGRAHEDDIIGDTRCAARLPRQPQQHGGLGHVFLVESVRGVVSGSHAQGEGAVETGPRHEIGVGLAVVIDASG